MLRPTHLDNLRCLALQTVANHLQIVVQPLYATRFALHKSCIFCKTRTLAAAFRCKYRTSVLPSSLFSAACALCTEKEGVGGCSAIMVNHNSRFGTDLKVGQYNGQPCGHGAQQCCAPTRATSQQPTQAAEKLVTGCRSRLQPRRKCLAINRASAPEGSAPEFFRSLYSRKSVLRRVCSEGLANGCRLSTNDHASRQDAGATKDILRHWPASLLSPGRDSSPGARGCGCQWQRRSR